MKILSVNGSPKGKNSNTDFIIKPFLEGAAEAGADTETIYLKDHIIKHCLGCFSCWGKTPGSCIQDDDMASLLEKFRLAQVIIYATPLYVCTVSGLMKDFMDRALPLLEPQMTKVGEEYFHPMRYPNEWPKKAVIISNSGFPGRHLFSPLIETVKASLKAPFFELGGIILRPTGGLLSIPELNSNYEWYFDALHLAGKQLIIDGHIAPKTQELLDQDFIDPESFANMTNAYWDNHRNH